MERVVIRWSPLVVAVAVGVRMTIALCGQTPEVISYSMPSTVCLHEPIILDIVVRNDSNAPYRLDLGLGDIARLTFGLVMPDGSRTSASPKTSIVRAEGHFAGMESGGHYEVAPGEQQAHYVILNRWLPFASPGVYLLTVHFGGGVQSGAGEALAVQRNARREIRVVPPDADTIRRDCSRLLAVLRDPIVGRRALAALSYTTDPVAVDYLAEAAGIEGGFMAQEPIDGLVRIGTPEARRVLEDLAQSPDHWMSVSASDGLTRIK
jgi:hypothetical protein